MSASAAASSALRKRLARSNGPRHDPQLVEAPLSYIQESIWLLDRFSSGTDSSVHRPCALTLPAVWSAEQIADALALLVERHHGLRSTYPIVDGTPRQRLQAPFVPDIRVVPVGAGSDWVDTVGDRVGAASGRVPPLGERPPLSAGAELVTGPDGRNALILPFHHVMFDGLSEELLCAELTAALRAQADSRGLDLPPPAVQPADWAVWQRANRTPESLQKSLDWWVRRLDGVENPWIDDGPDRSSTFAHCTADLDRETVERLTDTGAANDASLFAVLLHIVSRTVNELTGNDDLAVGVPISGRTSASLEGVIGCFINMVVVRPGRSIPSARDDLLAALDHQEVPYGWVVNKRSPGAGPRRPMVGLSMQLRNFKVRGHEDSGGPVRGHEDSVGSVEPWPTHLGPPSRSVDIIATPRAAGTTIEVRGSGGRFGPDLIAAVGRSIETTIRRVVEPRPTLTAGWEPSAEPGADGSNGSKDGHEAVGWIGASSPHLPPPAPEMYRPLLSQIHDRIEAEPEEVALRWDGMTLRRGELWTRAGQLADVLALAGVGRGDIVAIVGRRGPGILVAQLAVMRLGAVMLMVDPIFPTSHKEYVVETAKARAIIDIGGENWDADDGRRLPVDLLGLAAARGPERTEDDGLDVELDDPAYIMFTSGTSGRPKGIVGTHRTLAHLTGWAVEHGGLTEHDRVGFVIGVSFDVVFRNTIIPLAVGAEVAISADPLSPGRALRWAVDEAVTVVTVTPTMARTWASEAGPDVRLPNLRTWSSGEMLTPEVLATWEATTGSRGSTLNLYGPSETGFAKVFGPAIPGSDPASIAVGFPMPETEVLVVDQHDRPVPPGSAGEVLIRTRGGTAGYLDPADADGRFVANPWRNDESDMVYRTGDTGYIDPSHGLVIVGRLDDQVQIGGFRVEPAGTATTIERLDTVRHCVVDVVTSGPEPHLVAYVVPAAGATVDERAVVDHAASHLPGPAVPARVIALDRLPLTPAGKLDRRALPSPTPRRDPDPPQGPAEIALAKIWCEVLGIDSVGRNEEFVALGGTSLRVLIVADRVANELAVELSFNDLIGPRTLAEVAALIEQAPSARANPATPVRHQLLPLQAGMWFEQQLDPTSDAYNIPMVQSLRGPLDIDALNAAFRATVAAHEPLRTVIAVDDGVPIAEVADRADPEIEFTDLSSVDEDERERAAAEVTGEAANRAFNLSRPPLRVALVRLAPEHHILAVVIHHVAFDAASKPVLFNWLRAAYAAALSGSPLDLPPPAVSYRDRPVVVDSTPLPATVDQRVAALTPVPPPPGWPSVAQPAEGATTASIRLPIGTALLTGLTEVGRRLRATRAAVGLAAHIAFVHALTGADDVLVAVPASLRRPEDEDAIGLFVNTLVVRAKPRQEQSFADLVNEVRTQLAAAFDARAIPFDRLVRTLRLRSGGGGLPVTTAFQLGEADTSPELELDGLVAERLPTRLGAAKFPIVASLATKRGEYRLRVSPTIGDESTAAALAAQGSRLLMAALDDPSLLLGDLARAVAEADRPESEEDPDRWLQRIAEATTADPDRPSVEWGGGSWSRSELWDAALAAAGRLEQAGCGPGSRVALLAGRSPELIASMIGIRMIGAAWISLDADQPDVRINSILERLAPDAVIAEPAEQQRVGRAVTDRQSPPALLEPWIASPGDRVPQGTHSSLAGPAGDTAYLIATSGSTGVPHIVAVPPSALDAFAVAAVDRYGLTADDRVLQFHSTAFDASIEEIGPTLAVGAALVLAPENPLGSTQGYVRTLTDRRVSVASLPTRLWHNLVEDLADGRTPPPRSLRLMIIGGEAARPSTVRAWTDTIGPETTLLNTYGPTEATVVTHAADLTGWSGGAGDPVPIGHPIGDTRERIVGTDGTAVAPGEPGELWLGGPQLALGYLDEPEVTASRFITDDGVRWFRTGDTVRRLADRSLSFVGRLDDQVKIRGHRVELSEVSRAIDEHPAVSASAVLVDDTDGEVRLVAHVEAGDEVGVDEIRAHLSRIVPSYLAPARIVIGQALPRTPGNKIDRAALRGDIPAGPPGIDAGGGWEIPDRLAAIWMEVLEVETADPSDDFFAVGGHSLLAVKLASRLEEAFGREIPLLAIVEDPTLGAIARHLGLAPTGLEPPAADSSIAVSPSATSRAETLPAETLPAETLHAETLPADTLPAETLPAGAAGSETMPRPPEPPVAGGRPEVVVDREPSFGPIGPPLRRLHLDRGPLSSAQRRLWFLQQLDRDSSAYHIPVVYELRGRLDVDALEAAIRSTAARHEALRTTFSIERGAPLQLVDGETQVGLHRVTVDPAEGATGIDGVLADHATRPFRLDQDHPFRATLLAVGPGHHVLQLVFHHVAVDGASVPIILDDIAAGYRRALNGDDRPSDAPGLQQLDVAIDEHARLAAGEFDPVEQWWRARLRDLPDPMELPASGDGEAPSRFDVNLDEATTRRLLDKAAGHRASTSALVLALTAAALGRLTGRRDVVLGLPATQRVSRTEDVVGCFVNTLPIRCRLIDGMTMDRLIGDVSRTVIEAVDHRHLPVDRLVDVTGGRRDPGRPSLLQAVCNVSAASTRPSEFELPGLLTSRRSGRRSAVDSKFELSVTGGVTDGRLRLRIVTDSTLVGRGGTRVVAEAIEAMARAGDDAITGVPTTTDAARRWLVDDLNPDADRSAPTARVDELVNRWVAATPDAVAVVDGADRQSYRQLWLEAEEAARRLAEAGVEAGDRVVLIADRSGQQIVWSLGALIRRAVYVPVDPANPPARMGQLIDDADPSAIVKIDGAEATVTGRERVSPPCEPTAAYVMYTSGSTGAPKGVVVPHPAIVRLVDRVDYVELDQETVLAHVSNPAFDAATFEVWGALCNGGRLVVVPPSEAADPTPLASVLELEQVTTMFLTTALFNTMVASRPEALGRLDQLLFGGEGADANAVRRILDIAPPAKLIHVYGPTEATTFATFHVVETVPESAHQVPIGLPIDGTTVDVVDPWDEPCPPGVAGEVVIGGPGVALGYLGDHLLTDDRFVVDPVRGPKAGRVFRTGDLARRGPGGQLEFVGRRDRQVKLRGFRLDLGAIESAIADHPAVAVAALTVVGDGSRRRLVGVVVGDDIDPEQLRRWAGQRLAAHEVPWRLVPVEQLPLNPNGKVDRAAIEALVGGGDPDGNVDDRDTSGSAPDSDRDHLVDSIGGPVPPDAGREMETEPGKAPEQRMLDIWRTVLGRPDLRPDEEFFDAGGHSLLAIELMDAIEAEFAAELFVSDIFEYPTAAALASRVASDLTVDLTVSDLRASDLATSDPRVSNRAAPGLPPASERVLVELRAGSGRPLFCFHGGGGDVVGYANLAWQVADGIPVIGVRAPGLLASGTTDRTIEQMIDRYIPAVVARHPGGPFRLCGHSFGGILAYAAATRLTAMGYQVEFLGLLDTIFPVDHGGSFRRLVHKYERVADKGRDEVIAATRKFLRHRYQRLRVEFRVAGHRTRNDPVPARLARRRLKMRAVLATSAYQPQTFDGPVVFFKAMGNRKAGIGTAEDRWRRVAPDLTVYEVEGRHTGRESILTGQKVAAIVAEINNRLAP